MVPAESYIKNERVLYLLRKRGESEISAFCSLRNCMLSGAAAVSGAWSKSNIYIKRLWRSRAEQSSPAPTQKSPFGFSGSGFHSVYSVLYFFIAVIILPVNLSETKILWRQRYCKYFSTALKQETSGSLLSVSISHNGPWKPIYIDSLRFSLVDLSLLHVPNTTPLLLVVVASH